MSYVVFHNGWGVDIQHHDVVQKLNTLSWSTSGCHLQWQTAFSFLTAAHATDAHSHIYWQVPVRPFYSFRFYIIYSKERSGLPSDYSLQWQLVRVVCILNKSVKSVVSAFHCSAFAHRPHVLVCVYVCISLEWCPIPIWFRMLQHMSNHHRISQQCHHRWLLPFHIDCLQRKSCVCTMYHTVCRTGFLCIHYYMQQQQQQQQEWAWHCWTSKWDHL